MDEGASPEFLECLDVESRNAIARWNSQRAKLLRDRVHQEITAKLEENDFVSELSVPFIKVVVESNTDTVVKSDKAILTMWNPNSDQLDSLQEGALLLVQNLETKISRFDGLVQLSGNSGTLISVVEKKTHQIKAKEVIGEFSSILRLKVLTRGNGDVHDCNKSAAIVSLVGIVLKVTRRKDCSGWTLYLTDESNLQVRIEMPIEAQKLSPISALFDSMNNGDEEMLRMIAFYRLQTAQFDNSAECVVVLYTKQSTYRENPDCYRSCRLKRWVKSNIGSKRLRKHILFDSIGIEGNHRENANPFQALGFISGFRVLPGKPKMLIQVDSGGRCQTWKLPLAIMSKFAAECRAIGDNIVLESDLESRMKHLSSIGCVIRARQSLYRFTLKRTIEPDLPCTFEVSDISKVDTKALAALYSTLLE